MNNRNMADYADFDGKTNKKIVQAPGGASSLSLAWGGDRPQYGNQINNRNVRREAPYSYSEQIKSPTIPQYSEPMKVMEPVGYQPHQNYQNLPSQQSVQFSPYSQNHKQGYNMMQGPQQNYTNIPKQPSSYGAYNNQYDQIDIAMQQHQMKRPPSVPRQSTQPAVQGKSSIKINGPPRQNFVIGNDYNYWQDDGKQQSRGSRRQYSRQYQKQENPQAFGQRVPAQEYTTEKTSIRMHHPPGGKQNFSLG